MSVRPVFTNILPADVAIDKPGTDDLYGAFRSNPMSARVAMVGALTFGVQSTTSENYITLQTFQVFCPDLADYAAIQRVVIAHFEIQIVGSGNYDVRLVEKNTPVNGTALVASDGAYVWKYVEVAALKGQVASYELQFRRDPGSGSGTVSARAVSPTFGILLDY